MSGSFLPYPTLPWPPLACTMLDARAPSACGAAAAWVPQRLGAGERSRRCWRKMAATIRCSARDSRPSASSTRSIAPAPVWPSDMGVKHGTLPCRPIVTNSSNHAVLCGGQQAPPLQLVQLCACAWGRTWAVQARKAPCCYALHTVVKVLRMPITLYIINDTSESPGTSDSPPPACTTLRPCLRGPAGEQAKNHILRSTAAGAFSSIRQVRQMSADGAMMCTGMHCKCSKAWPAAKPSFHSSIIKRLKCNNESTKTRKTPCLWQAARCDAPCHGRPGTRASRARARQAAQRGSCARASRLHRTHSPSQTDSSQLFDRGGTLV